MTYRQIVYMCLDEIKAANGDSFITEEHVIFLLNHYRQYLLEQKRQKDLLSNFSEQNYQELCFDLEKVNAIPDMDYCNETYLRTTNKVPDTVTGSTLKAYPYDYFYLKNIAFISRDRFKFTGYNKYMRNIIYCTLGADKYLYLKSSNPQFLYMQKIKVSGIFNDIEEANKYLCCKCEDSDCDILDTDFPIQGDMVPQLIEFTVKELLGFEYHQQDDVNNSKDDLADLVSYIRQNAKSPLQKQIEQ